MRKSPVVRWQLWILGGITLLILYRALAGPPPREGLVVLENLDYHHIDRRTFEVDRAVQVSIEGVGSYETEDLADGTLAAYAWIIDDKTRMPVWQMSIDNTTRSTGTRAEVNDVLKLDAGTYHLFFASYGGHLSDRLDRSNREEADWGSDERHWYVLLNLADGKATDIRHVDYDEDEERVFSGERVVWQSGPTRNRSTKDFLFKIDEQVPFILRATGEFSEDANDYGAIENVLTGAQVWKMSSEIGVPAGGVAENRKVSSEIVLEPGLYRISYQTDATHAYDNWKGNPPFDPYSWGMVLTTRDTEDPIVAYDPWADKEPVMALMPFENDQLKVSDFTLTKKERVVVYGLGEMKRGDRYDYGWIERKTSRASLASMDFNDDDLEPNEDKLVWSMDYDRSEPAGGDDTNRRTLAFVDLVPDNYTLYYRTDGSHAFNDWSNGEPADGEHWGIAIFSIDNESGIEVKETLAVVFDEEDHEEEENYEPFGEEEEEAWSEAIAEEIVEVEAPPPPPMPSMLNFDANDVIVSLNKMGNNQERLTEMEIQGWTRLHVVALGEITASGSRYDYGYIKKAGTDEIVWEMNLDNTQPAGGDEANRIFDGIIELSSGKYEVFFKTDASHSFAGFDTDAPTMPEAWGITIAIAE